ncbi:response regulator [Flavobacteriaceae bacterium Ap0902]|nr:response regulator [Flavobacteriaceae bacterium Ap0902]
MRKKEAKILIVDDDQDVLYSAKIWLRRFFTEIVTLHHPKKIFETMDGVQVVLLDMNFKKGFEDGQDGLYLLNEIKTHFPQVPVILMTAYGEVDLAVKALKEGATDFILKPWDKDKLYASVNVAVDISRKNRKLNQWQNLQEETHTHLLQTQSPTMQRLYIDIEKVAPTEANVLLTGENGTGKYVLAEHIHRLSLRKKEPFVHIDLGSLPENLLETELFGYGRGAFTDAKEDKPGKIENANGGTVFLDEIGNLPLQFQTKLLTLIQDRKLTRVGETKERHLDIRFIFATNEDLQQKVAEEKFRSDLYFRMNTVEMHIPPLRERPEDLESFVHYFKSKYEKKYGKSDLEMAAELWQAIKSYPWPGNIRELDHSIERGVIMAEGGHLKIHLQDPSTLATTTSTLNIEEMEMVLVQKAMQKFKGNISQASEALGISRASLNSRLEKYNL